MSTDKGWTALDDMALQRDLSQKLDVEDSQFDGPDFTPEDKRTPLHPALEETKANFDAPSIIPETSPHKVVSKFVFDPNQLKERQAQKRRQSSWDGCCGFWDGYISSPEGPVLDTLLCFQDKYTFCCDLNC